MSGSASHAYAEVVGARTTGSADGAKEAPKELSLSRRPWRVANSAIIVA